MMSPQLSEEREAGWAEKLVVETIAGELLGRINGRRVNGSGPTVNLDLVRDELLRLVTLDEYWDLVAEPLPAELDQVLARATSVIRIVGEREPLPAELETTALLLRKKGWT